MRFAGVCLCLCLLVISMTAGCHRAAPALEKPPPAVKVTGAVKEDQLNSVELTEAAEKRLGIETATVQQRKLPRHRVYGGEVALPVGATVIVSAPVAGKLHLPEKSTVPKAGAAVVEKQPILTLAPLLSPAERITLATQRADAEGQIQQAQTQVEANEIALKRAERLVKESVGSARMVDEAKAQMQLSQKALEAAKSRKKILDQTLQSGESDADQPSFVIEAPQNGIIRTMHVMPEEVVTAGAVLFEVMNTDTLWVRVPVYVGETSDIAVDQPAEVGDLASRPGQAVEKAEPIAAPPTATALSSTVDLYYQISNSSGALRPGQRVSVQLPLVGDAEERVVPWSAIVQDIHGGDWVYVKIAEHKFARRRVQVKRVVDSWAVLGQGPEAGTPIVTVGVAEIFGSEFWKQ